MNLPQVGGLELPKQLAFPGDLASLLPAGSPLAGLLPKAATAAPAALGAPAAAAAPAAASALPGAAGLMPMLLPTTALSALP